MKVLITTSSFGEEPIQILIKKGFELDKKPWEYFYHHSGELLVNNTISNDMLTKYLQLNELNNTANNYI